MVRQDHPLALGVNRHLSITLRPGEPGQRLRPHAAGPTPVPWRCCAGRGSRAGSDSDTANTPQACFKLAPIPARNPQQRTHPRGLRFTGTRAATALMRPSWPYCHPCIHSSKSTTPTLTTAAMQDSPIAQRPGSLSDQSCEPGAPASAGSRQYGSSSSVSRSVCA